MARVLVCGLAVIDFVFELEDFPQGPLKFRTQKARTDLGGCAGVAASAVARLGGIAQLAARVGEDEVGSLTLARLQANGVDTSLVQASGGRTGFSSVCIDRSGERQIVCFPGEGLVQEMDDERLGPVDAVLADTRWPAGAISALRHARVLGVPGVLDAEAPVDEELLRLATHVAFSAQGLLSYAECRSLRVALNVARRRIDGWVCATDGAAGTYCFDGEGLRQVRPPHVQATDTLGAGDVWHGAFALRLAERADEESAIRFANSAAALYCTDGGKGPDAHTREQTEALLHATYG